MSTLFAILSPKSLTLPHDLLPQKLLPPVLSTTYTTYGVCSSQDHSVVKICFLPVLFHWMQHRFFLASHIAHLVGYFRPVILVII